MNTYTRLLTPRSMYDAYWSARKDVERALADWCSAPYGAKRDAFAVYRAAADREDAAAQAWLQSVRPGERSRPVRLPA